MSISHRSTGEKSYVKVPTHWVLADGSLLGLQMASYCLAVNSEGMEKEKQPDYLLG